MANLLSVDLPSSDEEDEDYNPDRDVKQLQKDVKQELLVKQGASAIRKGRAGGLAELPELAQQRKEAEKNIPGGPKALTDAQEEDEQWKVAARRRSQKNRVEGAWKKLQEGSLKAPQETGSVKFDKASFAAEALKNAKLASQSSTLTVKGKVLVKETRNFAGQNVEVVREVVAASKEGAKAIESSKVKDKKRGIDFVLQQLDRKRKLNIIDKTRLDWKEYKRDNKEVQDQLEQYTKGSQRYTDKVEFLQRTDQRQYEQERDMRLAASTRTRGRL